MFGQRKFLLAGWATSHRTIQWQLIRYCVSPDSDQNSEVMVMMFLPTKRTLKKTVLLLRPQNSTPFPTQFCSGWFSVTILFSFLIHCVFIFKSGWKSFSEKLLRDQFYLWCYLFFFFWDLNMEAVHIRHRDKSPKGSRHPSIQFPLLSAHGLF